MLLQPFLEILLWNVFASQLRNQYSLFSSFIYIYDSKFHILPNIKWDVKTSLPLRSSVGSTDSTADVDGCPPDRWRAAGAHYTWKSLRNRWYLSVLLSNDEKMLILFIWSDIQKDMKEQKTALRIPWWANNEDK